MNKILMLSLLLCSVIITYAGVHESILGMDPFKRIELLHKELANDFLGIKHTIKEIEKLGLQLSQAQKLSILFDKEQISRWSDFKNHVAAASNDLTQMSKADKTNKKKALTKTLQLTRKKPVF
jgi:ribosome-binding ATPase YchF (GTP1/OBG family)